jgi:hypothetical protein
VGTLYAIYEETARMTNLKLNISSGLNALIKNLGTNTGTFISITTLVGMGFSGGIYYNDYKKNIEILDLKKEHFLKLQELTTQNQLKELEISQLKFTLTKDEKESKK